MLGEVMDVDASQFDDPAQFIRIQSARKDAAVAVVNSSIKTDANRFRARKVNLLEDLLVLVKKEQSARIVSG